MRRVRSPLGIAITGVVVPKSHTPAGMLKAGTPACIPVIPTALALAVALELEALELALAHASMRGLWNTLLKLPDGACGLGTASTALCRFTVTAPLPSGTRMGGTCALSSAPAPSPFCSRLEEGSACACALGMAHTGLARSMVPALLPP
eukprot:1612021-Pleurochrysis_carterae.AAC.6